ncbi:MULTISPECIES: hypothetical protein [Flavobacteriaceae]|uniref:hypothetical protein n=1 Tax=Flavobacteriaceae TaxID=49546 RepID=UPI003A945A71
MIKKIKALIAENRTFHKEQTNQLKELEWAHVYHDSIRGYSFLEDLQLNVGRWAGNYAFFYVLHRVLLDYKPEKIVEFGLGESSKFISAYLNNMLLNSSHTIIEQNESWKHAFESKFELSKKSEIKIGDLIEKHIKGFKTTQYNNIEQLIPLKPDLYVVDGPIGSPRYSRYDIVNLACDFEPSDEFIIIFDDCNREGEVDTLKDLYHVLKSKDIAFVKAKYQGVKSVAVIATMKYRFVTTL